MPDTKNLTSSQKKTRKIQLAVNMPADNYKDLYEIAITEGCSTSDLACKALAEWVAEYKKLNTS